MIINDCILLYCLILYMNIIQCIRSEDIILITAVLAETLRLLQLLWWDTEVLLNQLRDIICPACWVCLWVSAQLD